jgi:type II secretory pathway component GspD/PulD (secretin)
MKKVLLFVLILISAACDEKARGMETKTFHLSRLSNEEAVALITPYIREGGTVSVSKTGRFISVREDDDRLKVIEDVLKRFDGIGQAVDVVLDIRIVQANGVTTRDSALADVEQTLRETFRYQGYRLVGQTRVQTREGTRFSQSVGSNFAIEGEVQRVGAANNEQRVPIEIHLMGPLSRTASGAVGPVSEMRSTVTATLGKPVVLGQSTGNGATILIITPSLAR